MAFRTYEYRRKEIRLIQGFNDGMQISTIEKLLEGNDIECSTETYIVFKEAKDRKTEPVSY